MKRILDFFLAIILVTICGIPMMIIAIFILGSMGSPVLFKQKRPGYLGNLFEIMKFRTMTNDSDTEGNILSDEVRLTVFGKFLRKYSLDELPQLLNVLKGDISFVGPRPLLPKYLSRYTLEQARRHEVKPGITGWAQVNGRNAISWEEKFKLDVWYVDHQSFAVDVRILWMTFVKVLKREGINAEGHATMPEFTGSSKNGE